MHKAHDITRSGLGNVEDGAAPRKRRPTRRVCVYCGASRGTDPIYAEAAGRLGAALAEADLELIYGGGTDGLMGVVAQSVLAHGGRVTGIIPTFLAHQCGTALVGSHDLIVVDHMHARKQAMFDKADAFIALPGGVGTLEELVEQMTWLKLGRHSKPLIIADIRGFWRPLLDLLDHMNASGFLGAAWTAPHQTCRTVDDILVALLSHFEESENRDGAGPYPGTRHTVLVEAADIAGRSRSPSRHDVYVAPSRLAG